jgi:hypothetical protein
MMTKCGPETTETALYVVLSSSVSTRTEVVCEDECWLYDQYNNENDDEWLDDERTHERERGDES